MDISRIENFISAYAYDEKDIIKYLSEYASKNNVPIIRNDTKNFIRAVIDLKKPRKVLEIGTAIGYSAIIIYDEIRKYFSNPIVYTIEDYPERIKTAKANFKKFQYDDIKLYEGDASIYIDSLLKDNESFDFIFLDAAKAQYPIWLDKIIKLLNKDGVLIADNIFKDGEILESRYAIEKRDRTIHHRMREYIHKIYENDKLTQYIFPIGDGISMTIKNA